MCPETTPFIAQSTTWVPSGSATATGDGFVGTAGSTATAIKSRTEHLDLTQEWSYYAPDMTVFYEGNPLFGVFSVRNELTALCLVEMTIRACGSVRKRRRLHDRA